jgi:hypothetical protein
MIILNSHQYHVFTGTEVPDCNTVGAIGISHCLRKSLIGKGGRDNCQDEKPGE